MTGPNIITLGCRLNAYESEVMRRHAHAAGLDDVVIVNTCAVTGEAVRQAAQTIRRVRRENPGAKIIVTGCAVQTQSERFAGMDEIDFVVGNHEKMQPETFYGIADETLERISVNDIMDVRETAGHLIDGFGTRARAYVQVQNGCDHRCTFCIIPYGRGPSRSVPAGEVVAQVARLVAQGYKEIVLTGVDMTSYGGDLPGRASLGKLVKQILRHVPDLARLRLSSIDHVESDADLLAAIESDARFMPHLHLSLQAGADLVLKRMKRRHLRADAIDFCNHVRSLRPDIVFGADLIAGFPTETEEQFRQTLDIVDACGLTYLHVFPFSPREGTPAARMPLVNGRVVKERAARLRQKGERVLRDYLAGQVGCEVELLMESEQVGRSPQFAEAEIVGRKIGNAVVPGTMVRARIVGAKSPRLVAGVCA